VYPAPRRRQRPYSSGGGPSLETLGGGGGRLDFAFGLEGRALVGEHEGRNVTASLGESEPGLFQGMYCSTKRAINGFATSRPGR